MGERREVKGLSGVGVPSRLFTWKNRDTTALAFVESNPQPGTVVAAVPGSLGLPSVRGGQDTSLDLAAVKNGNPGIHPQAGRFAWRATGATYWKGYTRPNIQSGWDLLDSNQSSDKYADTARIPTTGEVVIVTSNVNGAVESALRCRVWTPSTNTWASYSIRAAPPAGFVFADVAVSALLDGRLICIVSMSQTGVDVLYEVHTSTDSGQTWSRYEENAITIAEDTPISGSERGMLAVSGPEEKVCWIRQYRQQSTGNMRIFQYLSLDYGSTFGLVREWVTPASSLPADLNLLALPDRRLMLVYRTTGALLKFRIVGDPGQAFEDVAEQSISMPAQIDAVAAHVDEDGTVHIYAAEFSFSNTGAMYHLTSYNGGQSWTTPVVCWNTTSATDYPTRMVSVSGMSEHFVGMQHIADTGTLGKRFGVARFGGWAEPEQQDLAIPTSGTTANHVLLINAYELPFDMGTHWTRTGAGGTWALDAAATKNGATTLTLTGAADYVSHSYGAGFVDYFVPLKGEVISGGGLGFGDLALQLVSGDGADRYFGAISYSQTGTAFRVTYNELGNAATVDTAWDFSVLGRVHIRVSMDTTAQLLDVWYKSNGATNWSRVAGAPFALVTAAIASSSSVLFGSTLGTASVSEWEIGQVGVGSTGTLGIRVGTAQLRGLAIGAYAYPVPTIGPDTQIARLVSSMGPIFVGQTYTIAPVSDHPISSCYPDVTQKRRQVARTFDTGEHIVAAWDVETAFESMYMYVDGNVRSAVLEGTLTDWGSPVTIATYDPGVDFTAVGYNREGDSIKARVSGTSGARPLFNQELLEGWVDLGGGKLRKVRSNIAGEWTTGAHADIAKARIYLDGIDGTEGTASNCTIYSPRGVVVVHNVGKLYRKYRVRIPAGTNPWGYHELRYLSVGYPSMPGQQHARNWSWQRTRNAETRSDRAQSRYVIRTGTTPRFFSMSWQEGANMIPVRNGNADWIGADAGNPLAAYGLVAGWAMGLPEETDSGARMIVALPAMPKAGGTLTAPDLFCFGHLDSDVSVTNALGQQGESELERVDTVSVREGV